MRSIGDPGGARWKAATRAAPLLALLAGSLAALLGLIQPLAGQTIESVRAEVGAEPGEVTVGTPFAAALRVVAPPDVRIEYGEPASSDSVQLLAPVELVDREGEPHIALYRMVAWVAGAPLRAVVPVRLTAPGGEVEERWVRLHLPEVVSVLPAGDEEIEPRPAKGVVSPPLIGQADWFWWLLLLGVLLALLLAYLLLERARRAADDAVAPVDPRAWALRQLEAVSGEAAGGASQELYVHHRVVRILRSYCALVERAWSPDLTSSEVVAGVAVDEGGAAARELADILQLADRVRFGGADPQPGSAGTLIERARGWVTRYPSDPGGAGATRAA